METPVRLFHCARCHCQVVICSRCDRGQIYCSGECSQHARRESVRAAGRRYQRSRRGRLRHAERQCRYRRRREKVTHQGSPPVALDASLRADTEGSVASSQRVVQAGTPGPALRCHFCARAGSTWVRLGFLHRRATSASQSILNTAVPP